MLELKIYQKNIELTKKEASKLIGSVKLEKRIGEAIETFREDPNIECSWADGMCIEIVL